MDRVYFPVAGNPRTSYNFGQDRGTHKHGGIDIAAPIGTAVIAPVDLTITRANRSSTYGNVIYGKNAQGYEYRFAHLNDFNVSTGQTISAGNMIGTVGNTGRSSGPHLHFEVRDATGRAINPKGFLQGGKRILDSAKDRAIEAGKKAANAFLKSNPVTGPFAQAASLGGINPLDGESCGIVCQIRKWFEGTKFFQRLALAVLALIVIGGGLMLLTRGVVTKQISQLVK